MFATVALALGVEGCGEQDAVALDDRDVASAEGAWGHLALEPGAPHYLVNRRAGQSWRVCVPAYMTSMLPGVEAEIKLAKETAHAYIRKAKRAGRYFDDALWREARDHADDVVKLTRKGITARVLSKVTSSRAGKGIAGFLGFYAIASDGNVTGAELSRACADMTPLGWSLMGGEVLGEATEYLQDEIERTAEINRTSERWWMGPAHSRPTYNDCDR